MINPVRISHAVRDALNSPLMHAAQDYGKDQWQGLKNENALIAKVVGPVAKAIKYNKDTLMNQSLQGHVLQFAVPHVATVVTYHEAKKHGAKHAGLDALIAGHVTGTAVAAGAWTSYARYRKDASVAEDWTKGNRLAYTFFHGHSIKSAWDDHLSQSGLMDRARRNSTYQKLYNANIGSRTLGSRVREDILDEASKHSGNVKYAQPFRPRKYGPDIHESKGKWDTYSL